MGSITALIGRWSCSGSSPAEKDCRWEAGLECRGCRWEQTGNELSLTCELVWQGAICRTRRLAVLEDITVDEAAPKENRMPRGLYIYMAEEGESLWGGGPPLQYQRGEDPGGQRRNGRMLPGWSPADPGKRGGGRAARAQK